jgi:tRNA (guanine-N7-)-methyltransferase
MLPQMYPIDKTGISRPLIRTFHGRQGRLSEARLLALKTLVPKYSISANDRDVDLRKMLASEQVVIDFGCGMGAHTIELLRQGKAVISADVHTAGICDLAMFAEESTATGSTPKHKLRLFHGDGVQLLSHVLKPESISEIHVYFPDPWPKPRHAKRRLFNETFLILAARVLKPGGIVKLVTDDDGYADIANLTIAQSSLFELIPYQSATTLTSYHQRGLKLGHTIHEVAMKKY